MRERGLQQLLNPLEAELKKSPMPHLVRPMLPTEPTEFFDFRQKGWIYEPKLDGIRVITEVRAGRAVLYSRDLNTLDFPPINAQLKKLSHAVVLDGEIVILNEKGTPDREALQGYSSRFPYPNLFYYPFDLIWVDGYDIRGKPLRERKKMLKAVLPKLPNVRICVHKKDGIAISEIALNLELEGIVAKRESSTYQAGKRSRDWVKIKARTS